MIKPVHLGVRMAPDTMDFMRQLFRTSPIVPVALPLLSLGQVTVNFPLQKDLQTFQENLPTFSLRLVCSGATAVYDENVPTDYGTVAGSVFALIFEASAQLKAIRDAYIMPIAPTLRAEFIPHMIISEPISSSAGRSFLRSVADACHEKEFTFSGLAVSDNRVHVDNILSINSDTKYG